MVAVFMKQYVVDNANRRGRGSPQASAYSLTYRASISPCRHGDGTGTLLDALSRQSPNMIEYAPITAFAGSGARTSAENGALSRRPSRQRPIIPTQAHVEVAAGARDGHFRYVTLATGS